MKSRPLHLPQRREHPPHLLQERLGQKRLPLPQAHQGGAGTPGGWEEAWEGCLAGVVEQTGEAFCLLFEIPLHSESF